MSSIGKIRAYASASAIAACLLGISAPAHTAAPKTFGGFAQAKDGDSLLVGQREVRLFGIDAPEFDQSCTRGGKAWACGAEAATALRNLVTGREVDCQAVGADQFGRTLAKCSVGTIDINRSQVLNGHATAFRRYSEDYVVIEGQAKAAKRGIWAGEFQNPSDYRAGSAPRSRQPTTNVSSTRSASSRAASSRDWAGRARANCNIKGNRNRKGQWLYHLPGMPYYDQTRPEDIFCTEAEAQAAGYRRAIVR